MSTQQNNAEVADGHSFADKIGQLVSAKYQALFGTTTYSKRRVMSGVVMTRYVSQFPVSMTQLSLHTFAHLTGSSFRLKAKLLPNKKILGLKYT